MYRRAWQVYKQFCDLYRPEAPLMPATSDALALFIAYLSARKLAPSTITSYVSAVGYVHRLQGLPDPTKAFLVQKLFKAIGRERTADIRLPITRPVLNRLVSSLRSTNSSASQRQLLSAMFLTAFYGFFRIGELATKAAGAASSVLQFSALQFIYRAEEICSVKLTITKFKHNANNRPFDIVIDRENSPSLCPVQHLVNYCRLRGDRPGPLFCLSDLTPVSVNMFNTELQRCLIFCGLDTKRYKSHSFRIGVACYASEKGFSHSQIRKLGRWKSDAYKVYLRSESLTMASGSQSD